MPITINDFQTNAYQVQNTQNVVEVTYGPNDDHHRVRKNNYFGTNVIAGNIVGTRLIKIVAGTDTVFLPYYQSKIASVRLPSAGPDFFITDNMSGCALFIGKGPGGDLVVFHANSQQGSDQATMDAHAPSFQSRAALREIDTQMQTAKPHHSTLQIVCSLTKPTYLANVDQLASTGANFLGGTTIAGWRTGTLWEFWYQNWGQVGGSGGVRLLKARKFYQQS